MSIVQDQVEKIIASVETHKDKFIKTSQVIHARPEIGKKVCYNIYNYKNN